jgi:hypothetical protein
MPHAGLTRARRAVLACAFTALLAAPPVAGKPSRAASAAAGAASVAASAPRLVEDGHYRNVDGAIVHSPAHTDTSAVPAGASARCRDGSFSFSAHRRGTCSHHGGVARWL